MEAVLWLIKRVYFILTHPVYSEMAQQSVLKKLLRVMKTRLNLELLQSSPQQSYNLRNFHIARTKSTHNQLHVHVACTLSTLASLVFVEC